MDDDEVVSEIDVYLSKSLADNLFIFQYPTRPSDRPYDGRNVVCARMKPKQQKVEIDMHINVDSHYYNRSKGEQIALNVDGPGADYTSGGTYYSSSLMDKQVLTSSQVSFSSGCYAVGVLRQGRLHITPVKSLLQLRPSFEYLDKSYSRGQMENKDVEEEKQEPQAVTVKFAGPNAERSKKAREKSYCYLQQKWEAEPWIQAHYHIDGSNRSKLEFEKLFCAHPENEVSNISLSPEAHLKALVPPVLLQSQEENVNNGKEIESIWSLKSLPLFDRLKNIMISAQVLKFDHIVELLPPENLEKYLQQIAVLVQGCWVVKSDAIYGKDTTSPYTGISSDILIRARDYILWCFTKSRHVSRSEVLAVIKIPDEDVTALLQQVAKKVYNKGWEFKYLFDKDFVDNYPNVVQRQEMLWDVRYKQLSRDLRLGQITAGDMSPRKSFPPPPSPKERRHFKYRDSFSDDTEESGIESGDKMDVDHQHMKKARLPKRTTSNRVKRLSDSGSNKKPIKFRQSIDVLPTFLPTLHSSEVKSELLNHVQEVLHEKLCLTVGELKETLSDASLGFIEERDDCDALLEETLSELGAQRLKNKWPQNTQPVALYAFTKLGTPLDRYRNALLDLFTNTARSRPNFLVKKIEDENGEIVSENVCKQIFEEYCIYKSGYYYLKGTISPDS